MMKIGEEKIHEKIDIISNEICNKKGEKIVNINCLIFTYLEVFNPNRKYILCHKESICRCAMMGLLKDNQ